MSENKRKIFSGAQKAKLAVEAIKGEKTVNQIAQEFGVHPTQVSQWKKELLENAGSLFEAKRAPKPASGQHTERPRPSLCQNWATETILNSLNNCLDLGGHFTGRIGNYRARPESRIFSIFVSAALNPWA